MLSLLLVSLLLQAAYSRNCPNFSYMLVKDGECRGEQDKILTTFDQAAAEAIASCNHEDGLPMIIHDDEHQDYWTNTIQAPAFDEGFSILGLVCNTATKRYEWADGSAVDYRPAAGYNKELDGNCSPEFGWFIISDGYWNYGGPGSTIQAFIFCTIQFQQIDRGADGCDGYGDDADDGLCYQVGRFAAHSKEDAESTCKMFGGDLASIHSLEANSFIRRLAVSEYSTYGVFIGTQKGNGGKYEWIDGSPMDYDNFAPGFPNGSLGECVVMDTSSTKGQWMNVDCSSRFPPACSRPQKEVVEPTCPGAAQEYKENMIIINLEGNSCCEDLILYEGATGDTVIAKVSGAVSGTSYTTRSSKVLRVSWQPNGGVNVIGAEFTFSAF